MQGFFPYLDMLEHLFQSWWRRQRASACMHASCGQTSRAVSRYPPVAQVLRLDNPRLKSWLVLS